MLALVLLAVLTAIALPLYQSERLKFQDAQAEGDITALSAKITTYYWENHGLYPASLADVRASGMRDPWGHPYVYYNIAANGKGHALKDKALNPLNTDFDLYSLGPDGQTQLQITQASSLDDVIRANDGRFIGVASSY